MKIFGIGLSNTGTTSLAKALEVLGYRAVHYPWSLQEIDEFDAAVDIPVACRYRELDERHPGSRFILTTRPFEEWIDRRRRKPVDKDRPQKWVLDTRIRMYGSITFDAKLYTEAYYRHHEEVNDYFKERLEDLLILPLKADDKWERLCGFLGKEIPSVEYPWEKIKST
jgi:hypothetical protein